MPARASRCYLVDKDERGTVHAQLASRALDSLPAGEVLVQVRYSSLNYKDAMAATGHPGITKNFPHVPGIDAAGAVAESTDPRYRPGDKVIATGHEIGVERWGGWAEFVRVPADWLVPLPAGLTLEESMILGTAGFTAAQSVQALLQHHVSADKGPVVVTGATGGVGSLAVMILAKLGFHVVAVTGKTDQQDWLKSLGAAEVAGRDLLTEEKPRPLLAPKYAGGIDTVGGGPLSTLCKMIRHRGCIACCGLTAGADLHLTVYPFILRGLTLAGIDSAWCPDDERKEIWQTLASDWKPTFLDQVKHLVPLADIGPYVEKILAGKNVGRVVVDMQGR